MPARRPSAAFTSAVGVVHSAFHRTFLSVQVDQEAPMRAEIQAVADEIEDSLALLRRHL
jgi:hypothetical protein